MKFLKIQGEIMKMKIIFAVLLGLIFSNAFGQGCMEASSDEGVSVVGYIQAQYEYKFQDPEDDLNEFTFNRLRFGLVGNIPYDFSYYTMFEMSPNKEGAPYVLDGFITYSRLDPYLKISIGQFKSPFSLEINTACQGLYTINRSNVVSNLAIPFRDRGLLLSGAYQKSLKYALAITNGTGLGIAEDNYSKDYLGRIVYSVLPQLNIGGSFGMRTLSPAMEGAEEDDKLNIFAGELEVNFGGFKLQGEYLTADHESSGGIIVHSPDCSHPEEWTEELAAGTTTKAGFWVMAMYMTDWMIQPVIKYEQFDPNTDDENTSSTLCIQKITTFGINYFFNDWTRLQLNYLYKAEEEFEESNDEILMQLQVKF